MNPNIDHAALLRLNAELAPLGQEAAGIPAANQAARAADQAAIKPGSFSISDWSGYPDSLPRPNGPFRLLEGQEYEASRNAANRINRKLRNADPPAHEGKEVHEIQPVKFGGDPIDPAVLPKADHHVVSRWWDRQKWNLMRDNAK